jgi:two-component system, OmpR family, sensor kinase
VAGVARSARTRILIAYIVLLAISAVASTFAIRQILTVRLNDQVDDVLEQEVLELEDLIKDGRNPETGDAFTSVRQFLDVFLERQVLSDDEAMLAYAEGQLVGQKVERFPLGRLPFRQEAAFRALSTSTAEGGEMKGTFETSMGTAHYHAHPIVIHDELGKSTGVFIATMLPAGELNAMEGLQTWGTLTTLAVLLIASMIAWVSARLVRAQRQ